MNFSDYDINKKKNSNKNLKSKNESYSGKRNINNGNETSMQKSNSNNSMNNSSFPYINDLPKFLQQENPGKLQIFKTNSIVEPEINTATVNYNGYTSHDMRLLWTAFGNMPDEEKNSFLKGLVYRFGQKQIDLTCTLLNLKVEEYIINI